MSEAGKSDRASIEALLQKVNRALDDASYLLEDDRVEAAVNRAYYAAFHAARAALLTEGEEPTSHAGILSRFSYHFIRTGRISEEVGQVLARAETDRNRADYDAFPVFEIQAAEAVRGRLDWKYLLALELTDPRFDFSVLSEFRSRLLGAGKEAYLLDRLLEECRDRKLLKARGRQRTDSTRVLAATREMNRLELVASGARVLR